MKYKVSRTKYLQALLEYGNWIALKLIFFFLKKCFAIVLICCFPTVVACEVPRLPSNLLTPNVLCLGSVTYNTTCHFVCDVGYNLTGESSVTCLEDTTLSAPLPSCEGGFIIFEDIFDEV